MPLRAPGVTVLLEEPTADDVNTTSMFSQKFEEEVYPPNAEKSDDPTKTGTSWTKPQDESIVEYGRKVRALFYKKNPKQKYDWSR